MKELDRARDALHAIDAGCDRDTWVRAGMACKAAGLAESDFEDWSRGASNFKSERDCRDTWRSFKANGGIGAGTLFAMARDAGWGETLNGHARPQATRKAPRKAEDKTRHPPLNFAAVWADAEPAPDYHDYIGAKLGLSIGLRVYRGDEKINRESIDGALLVPAYDGTGSLMTWQAILPSGRKLNAPGRPVSGWFTLKGNGKAIYVCEGIGQAWSSHQATSSTVVCAFGFGNMSKVAEALQSDHDLVLVADIGKEAEIEHLAAKIGCRWIAPPDDLGDKADINDMHKRDGLQAVADLLSKAVRPEMSPIEDISGGGTLPKLKTAAELLSTEFTPIRWLIPGLLPEGLMVLAARPKIGKSWLALDVAIACATGGRVLDRQVEQGDVLYLALEDSDRRMHSRLSKLKAAGIGLGDLQYATQWPRGAEGAAAIHEWIDAHPRARLVVLDVFTKLRSATEGRETAYTTDYTDVAMLKPPADRGVSILLVHHTRKADSDDPLDSISGTLGIGGAADGAWIIKRARGSDEAELHLIGRDLEEEGAFAVKFDRETCRWQWVGEAWRVRISGERRSILDALAAGPAKPGDIAKLIGKNENAVRYLLHAMVKDGQVDRGLDGQYRAIEPEETEGAK